MRTALALLSMLIAGAVPAQTAEPADLAAGGYDVVAYHLESAATPGAPAHALEWNGLRWQFASARHLRLFEADPIRYAPRFAGHCSLTVAHGALIPGDPEAWAIHEGQLYLFFHQPARETWLMNPERLIPRAEARWAELTRDRKPQESAPR